MNVVTSQVLLEAMAQEFIALVVGAGLWTRIPGKPFVFEFQTNMSRGLVVYSNQLAIVRNRVNHGERTKGIGRAVDGERPRTNEVDGNLLPSRIDGITRW